MASKHHNPEADETLVDLSAGIREVRGIQQVDAYNGNGAETAYVQLFDVEAAEDVTLGTTVPDWVVCVPAGGGNNPVFQPALGFLNGVVYAVTGSPDGADAPDEPIVLNIACV